MLTNQQQFKTIEEARQALDFLTGQHIPDLEQARRRAEVKADKLRQYIEAQEQGQQIRAGAGQMVSQ